MSPPDTFFLFFLADSMAVLFFLFFVSFPTLSYSGSRTGFLADPQPTAPGRGYPFCFTNHWKVGVRVNLIRPQLAQTLLPVALDTC